MARNHIYTVQKGDSVRPEFVGTKVELTQHDAVADAIAAGHFESERAIMDAANAQRNIAANRVVRKALSTEGASVTDAVTKANAVKLGAARVGVTPKTAKPATIAKNSAASSGNRLFIKCAADSAFLDRMVKQGIVERSEFDSWQAAQAPAAPATAGATT